MKKALGISFLILTMGGLTSAGELKHGQSSSIMNDDVIEIEITGDAAKQIYDSLDVEVTNGAKNGVNVRCKQADSCQVTVDILGRAL